MKGFDMIQVNYLFRILLAAVCGALIGYERERRLKTAGIRTHVIVSLASALMMVLSKYGFQDILGMDSIGLDPSRIAAGIVTAIGFLGAGVIFNHKQTVIGLTTAAGIWATVGVGMAIGAGMYLLGITAALMMILIQVILHQDLKWMKSATIHQLQIYMTINKDVTELYEKINEIHGLEVIGMKLSKEKEQMLLILEVRVTDTYPIRSFIEIYEDDPDILSIDM